MSDLQDFQDQGRARLTIEGLWCPSCAAAVERKIQRIPGVIEVGVSFATTSATLKWDPARLNLMDLAAQVKRLGYRLVPPVDGRATLSRIDSQIQRLSVRLVVAAFFSVWVMAFSLVLYIGDGVAGSPTGNVIASVAGVLSLPVIGFCGLPIFLAGWRTLRTGIPGMDTLVSLGSLSAFGASLWQLSESSAHVYFDTAVMLVTLLTLGRLVETRTLRHSSAALDALQHTIPEAAGRLDHSGRIEQVDAASVIQGEIVRVAAGDRVPLDGIVVAGSSHVDKAILTGESEPLAITVGDNVEAGCVNLLSPFSMRVDGVLGERHIDRIGLRIAEAAGARSETQRLADRFAGWLVPVAMVIAATTFTVAFLAAHPIEESLLRALSVLIVACPCAMAMAIPVVYVTSARQAARHQILFRTPRDLEHLGRARQVFFDKTGTLTEGRLSLAAVNLLSEQAGYDRNFVLQLAATMERDIRHPVAQALTTAAKRCGAIVSPEMVELNVERHERGVICRDSPWGPILLGSAAFLSEHGIECVGGKQEIGDEVLTLPVELAIGDSWVGSLILEDRLHVDALESIKRLRALGIHCTIVSGDRASVVNKVGSLLEFSEQDRYAECSPQDKADIVKLAGSGTVFVGDGVNDGPAIITADVGIAVASAVGPAMAAAGVAIGEGGVSRVAASVVFARRSRTRMLQNIGFSVSYNAIAMTLAVAGAVPPLAATVAMALSSLTVILNASRPIR